MTRTSTLSTLFVILFLSPASADAQNSSSAICRDLESRGMRCERVDVPRSTRPTPRPTQRGTRTGDRWQSDPQPRSDAERARQGRDVAQATYGGLRCVRGRSVREILDRALTGCGYEAGRVLDAAVPVRLEYGFVPYGAYRVVVTDIVRNQPYSADPGQPVEFVTYRHSSEGTDIQLIVDVYDVHGHRLAREVFRDYFDSSWRDYSRGAVIVAVRLDEYGDLHLERR